MMSTPRSKQETCFESKKGLRLLLLPCCPRKFPSLKYRHCASGRARPHINGLGKRAGLQRQTNAPMSVGAGHPLQQQKWGNVWDQYSNVEHRRAELFLTIFLVILVHTYSSTLKSGDSPSRFVLNCVTTNRGPVELKDSHLTAEPFQKRSPSFMY